MSRARPARESPARPRPPGLQGLDPVRSMPTLLLHCESIATPAWVGNYGSGTSLDCVAGLRRLAAVAVSTSMTVAFDAACGFRNLWAQLLLEHDQAEPFRGRFLA